MEHMELARALRADQDIHYNCCQSVLVTFADDIGLTREQAKALGPTSTPACATGAPAAPCAGRAWCWGCWATAIRRPAPWSGS